MAKAPGDLPAFVLKTQGWAAGVNIREGVNFMGPDASRPMENIVLNERGVARKRLGCETHGTFGASADRVLSMYTYYRGPGVPPRSEEHTSELQSLRHLVCRLLLEKKKKNTNRLIICKKKKKTLTKI